MQSINTTILSSRDTRLIKTVISFTKAKQFLFNVVDVATANAGQLHIAIVSTNDELAESQLTRAIQQNPSLEVLFIGADLAQVGNKKNHLLHKKLVSDLVPTLERLAGSLSMPQAANPTYAPAPQSASASASRPAPVLHITTKPPRERLRALVVDDSPTVRTQLVQTVERMSMACDSAESAAVALRILEQRSYDVIYVDVVMPDMDGYKLTREIKRSATHKATPVIILTSQSSPFDRARGALAGCDTFLTKPVDIKRFFEATAKVLRKKRAVDDLDSWITDPTAPAPVAAVALAPSPVSADLRSAPIPYKAS
jgi:two-component system, cell cycle response regulator